MTTLQKTPTLKVTQGEFLRLLRLLEFGWTAREIDIHRRLAAIWLAFPDATREKLIARPDHDGRRTRLWAAGWTQGRQYPEGALQL